MEVFVCVKRVPATGGTIFVSSDQQEIQTRHLGFTISPDQECAIVDVGEVLYLPRPMYPKVSSTLGVPPVHPGLIECPLNASSSDASRRHPRSRP